MFKLYRLSTAEEFKENFKQIKNQMERKADNVDLLKLDKICSN